MKTKLLTIAMTAALMLTAMTKVQAQNFDGPCLPPSHGLVDHQSAFCSVTQAIALTQGANWVSFYVEVNIDDLKAALLEVTPNSSIKIQGRTQNTTYNPNNHRWTGQLKALDLSQMYIIIVAEACEISLEGMLVDPSDHPATIEPGSNYIAYPFNTNMTVTNAFADFAIQNDKIQSMTQNTSYNGSRWTGRLKNLESSHGYIYNSASTETRVFIFSNGSSKAAPVPNK